MINVQKEQSGRTIHQAVVESEIAEVKAILATIPAESLLERMSFEKRLKQAEDALQSGSESRHERLSDLSDFYHSETKS